MSFLSLLMDVDPSSGVPDILLCASGSGGCCWASREWRANLAASCRRAREGGRFSGGGMVGIDEEAEATVFGALGFYVHELAYRSWYRKQVLSNATKITGIQ